MSESITLKQVTKIYNGMQGAKALDTVSVGFYPGEFVAVAGRSGSGKSTLLNMIACIDRPTQGEIYYGGERLDRLSESKLTRWRGENIGIVFQFFQLMPTLTVLENVVLPMDFTRRIAAALRKNRAMSLLERVGLADQTGKLPSELSGGQQQRAAVARALANRPAYVVADEPTGNLDSVNADSMMALFRQLAEEGTAVIMVTHNRELAARTDRIVTISDGIIVDDRGSSYNKEEECVQWNRGRKKEEERLSSR